MKVNLTNLMSGQMAGSGDLASLLTGDGNASFASLLGLSSSEPGVAHAGEGNRGKQDNRPKEKESSKDQSPAGGDSRPSGSPSSLGLQTIPNVGVTPWGIQLGDSDTSGVAVDAPLSLPGGEATNNAFAARTPTLAADAPRSDVSTLTEQPALNQNAAQISSVHDLSDRELTAPLKNAMAANQEAGMTRSVAPQNEKGVVSTLAKTSSATSNIVGSSSTLANNRLPALIQQDSAAPKPVTISVTQNHASSSHEVKPVASAPNIAINAGEQSANAGQNSQGQERSSSPMQGAVEPVSSSSAGSQTQGNGGDAHRGSTDAKEAVANSHASTSQTPQAGTLGALGKEGVAYGHSAPMTAAYLQPSRESVPNAQPKELLPSRVADPSAARLFGSTMRGDLRVGVQTEAFGRVTIQTNAQGGQLSAQLSLENTKESATLAAHLPGVEQKIVQQHGLNASVRLVGGFDGGVGAGSAGRDQSGSSRQDPGRHDSDVVMRPGGIEQGSSHENRAVEPALLGSSYLVTSRLDVTV